jgi:hypothetical protein
VCEVDLGLEAFGALPVQVRGRVRGVPECRGGWWEEAPFL